MKPVCNVCGEVENWFVTGVQPPHKHLTMDNVSACTEHQHRQVTSVINTDTLHMSEVNLCFCTMANKPKSKITLKITQLVPKAECCFCQSYFLIIYHL